ncbi:MAG: Maf family protein [Phycisphaerales bacterium]
MTDLRNQPRRRVRLASRSPRRRQLLESSGFEVHAQPASIDDADLRISAAVNPEEWTVALAYLKARNVADQLGEASAEEPILGADTIVDLDGVVIGQPSDEGEAREIILALEGRPHRVVTGVAVLEPHRRRRVLFVDVATVTVGRIGQKAIDAYLGTGAWRGKAGAYNLIERVHAGWPIQCDGDPASVMGLPMARLVSLWPRLAREDSCNDSADAFRPA